MTPSSLLGVPASSDSDWQKRGLQGLEGGGRRGVRDKIIAFCFDTTASEHWHVQGFNKSQSTVDYGFYFTRTQTSGLCRVDIKVNGRQQNKPADATCGSFRGKTRDWPFFDSRIDVEEKKKMDKTARRRNSSDWRGKKDDDCFLLSSFVTSKTRSFFQKLDADEAFLAKDSA
ncbi:hypothetical protein GWK47_025660 [Chionoecetes opilio]|uniref:Uncharacterized protein n=1 Tax=Chionoecetes opilio TaxID=41210 RepID=A0A8J8WG06_CHIOP|nr:hypothetical protein GWK47_025660 [Chionoecetes opilio]